MYSVSGVDREFITLLWFACPENDCKFCAKHFKLYISALFNCHALEKSVSEGRGHFTGIKPLHRHTLSHTNTYYLFKHVSRNISSCLFQILNFEVANSFLSKVIIWVMCYIGSFIYSLAFLLMQHTIEWYTTIISYYSSYSYPDSYWQFCLYMLIYQLEFNVSDKHVSYKVSEIIQTITIKYETNF